MLPESGRRRENTGPAFLLIRFIQSGKKVKESVWSAVTLIVLASEPSSFCRFRRDW
ncbi:hypothetical protein D3C72_2118520 [compost metagenome]